MTDAWHGHGPWTLGVMTRTEFERSLRGKAGREPRCLVDSMLGMQTQYI